MELTVGCVYKVNHSSGLIRWKFSRIEHQQWYGSVRVRKRYVGVNLGTGREVTLKSTAKVRCELESPHGTEAGMGNYV